MSTAEKGKVIIPLHRPGLSEKLFFLTSGAIISIPFAFFFESLPQGFLPSSLPPFYADVLYLGVLAPVIEELGKAYPLFFRHGENQRSIITLGALVGLGFGFVEFLEYVLLLGVPVIFRVPGLIFHPASTSVTAYGIANKKSARFYLVAVALHLSSNLASIFEPLQSLIFPIVILTFLLALYLYQKTPEKPIEY